MEGLELAQSGLNLRLHVAEQRGALVVVQRRRSQSRRRRYRVAGRDLENPSQSSR